MAIALWPAETSSSAAERTALSCTSASATEAPASAKALAVARPMPEAAPVTSATLFSNKEFMKSFLSIASSELAGPLVRTLLEDFPRDRQRREGIRPADVERQMRDDFCGLRLCQAVIHRPVEVIGHLRDLAGSNERAHRDQAPVARRKIGAQPQITEQYIRGILHDPGGHRAKLLLDACRTLRFDCLVERQKLRRGLRKLIRSDGARGKDILRGGNRRH